VSGLIRRLIPQTDSTVSVVSGLAGSVTETLHSWLGARPPSVGGFGAVSDGATNDAVAFQAAVDASTAWSLAAITGTAGSACVGGGILDLSHTALGILIGASIKVTNSKLIVQGPCRINVSAGVVGFLFTYAGSHDHSGVVFRNVDFVGGATAIDIGLNSDTMPVTIEHCSFINQTVASIKTGNNGFWVDISKCRFSGNAISIWHHGTSADGLNIERCVFEYNSDFDILIDNGANVASIIGNDFIGNLKSPAASAANIKIDTTVAQTGSHSIISRNKFGPESRVAGNIILVSGANPLIGCNISNNSPMGFDSSAPGGAIKIVGTALQGCFIHDNVLVYSSLFDAASTEVNDANAGQNRVGPNYFIPYEFSSAHRGDFTISEFSELAPWQKSNLLAWSRYVNDAGNFTYTNATPTYMTSTDENGVANNATSLIATSAANAIRINTLNTNNVQQKYTFTCWLKLAVASQVTFSATRAGNAAFSKVFNIGTVFQRVVIEFYQTYYAAGNPYVVDLLIPNGATVTLGGVCCVPGRDAGDLRKTPTATEFAGGIVKASAAPVAGYIYWPANTVFHHSAPAVGTTRGWVATTSGNPPTPVAMAVL
jgi:hypothetical protein